MQVSSPQGWRHFARIGITGPAMKGNAVLLGNKCGIKATEKDKKQQKTHKLEFDAVI
jgi:hypothetical protein